MTLHLYIPAEPPPVVPTGMDALKAATKEAFKRMSDAASKVAAIHHRISEQATDPKDRQTHEQGRDAWRNAADNAWKEMQKL